MKTLHHPPKRLLATVALLMLLPMALLAQQRMRYSQYLLNTYLVNPAVTGVEPYWDLRAGVSQQWVGIPGAPRSIYVTGHRGLYSRNIRGEEFRLNSLPAHGRGKALPTRSIVGTTVTPGGPGPNFHMGVGGQIFSEQTGPISYSGVTGSFAGHLRLTGNLRLGVGVSMEMLNYRLNPTAIEMLNANDVTLTQNRVSLLLPTMNAGIVLYSQRFFATIASRQLLRTRITVNPANPTISGLETHYFAQAGLKLKVADKIGLTPSVALRMISPAPPSIDLSLQGNYKDQFFLGFSYRHLDALVFLAGFRFNQNLRLDYAYDNTTSSLSRFSSGSHSLVLSFCPGYGLSGGRRYFW